ncbi:MAG: HD domain-containing protein [Cyanobacteria bacterium J06639_1]
MLKFCKSRTYHDPLHGSIRLDGTNPAEALLIRLIDTPAFQRLRRIRQLDTASLTFHGAEGSRFTHSVGVLHVARRVFDRLAQHHGDLAPYRALTLVAALLHDVGHGPFSHAGEEIFGSRHEHWTRRILHEDPQIRDLLSDYDPNFPDRIDAVYRHECDLPLVEQIISSQLDCDRLDYLLRDSHFTGAQYGRLDLERLIAVMDYDPERREMMISARKGLGAIEHYLVVRYFMYTQVYQHPKSLAARFVLSKLFDRARELLAAGELTVDPILTAWLQGSVDDLPLKLYLAADDIMFQYPIRFWSEHPDPILSDLARRYLDRDIFKARNLVDVAGDRRQALRAAISERLQNCGFAPNYYSGVIASYARGYTLYHQGISLRTDRGWQEIAELSPLVRTLATAHPQEWLIFPREMEDIVNRFWEDLPVATRSPVA